MNALEKLADWVANSDRKQSEANLARATDSFIDTLACNLSGLAEPVVSKAYQSIKPTSAGNITAFGFGQTSAASAALVNATASHSQDFDDYNRSSVAHTSTVLIPTALAVSEQLGSSGEQCLDASIVGLEVMVYLGSVINMDHYLRGWHATATLGAIGAAAVASRLMRLDAEQCGAAMSLATSMIGGFKLQFGTMAKPLHAGLAAQAGINAALFASNGMIASTQIFDDEAGITSLWSDTNPGKFTETVIPESGKLAIEREGLYVKRYPSCGYTSRAIDGLIELMDEHSIDAADIKKLEIDVPDRHAVVVSYAIPQNSLQAKFSFPYCLAIAALHNSVTSQHFIDEAIGNSKTRAMMDRVTVNSYTVDPGLDDLSPDAPDCIRIQLYSGQQYEKTVAYSQGSPEKPLSRARLFEKFWHCAKFPNPDTQSVEESFNRFHEAKSVSAMIEQLNRLAAKTTTGRKPYEK